MHQVANFDGAISGTICRIHTGPQFSNQQCLFHAGAHFRAQQLHHTLLYPDTATLCGHRKRMRRLLYEQPLIHTSHTNQPKSHFSRDSSETWDDQSAGKRGAAHRTNEATGSRIERGSVMKCNAAASLPKLWHNFRNVGILSQNGYTLQRAPAFWYRGGFHFDLTCCTSGLAPFIQNPRPCPPTILVRGTDGCMPNTKTKP